MDSDRWMVLNGIGVEVVMELRPWWDFTVLQASDMIEEVVLRVIEDASHNNHEFVREVMAMAKKKPKGKKPKKQKDQPIVTGKKKKR